MTYDMSEQMIINEGLSSRLVTDRLLLLLDKLHSNYFVATTCFTAVFFVSQLSGECYCRVCMSAKLSHLGMRLSTGIYFYRTEYCVCV